MESKIFFIRHGITVGNQNRWFYGSTDLPLADEGMKRLSALTEAGAYPRFAEDADYYTTGLLRTEQTLSIIAGDREHGVIENLKEMRFGDYECVSYEDVKDDPVFNEWGYDTTGSIALPNAECQNDFTARVLEGLKELRGFHRLKELSHRHNGKPAHSVMVCHGGVISTLMCNLFPEDGKTIWDWMPDPGCGYIVSFEEGEPSKYETIGVSTGVGSVIATDEVRKNDKTTKE